MTLWLAPSRPTEIAALALLLGSAIAIGVDRLYARSGYNTGFPDVRGRTRLRIVGYSSLCALATLLTIFTGLWLPLLTLLGALAGSVWHDLTSLREFASSRVPGHCAGPDANATVETGLVLAELLSDWYVWAPLALLTGIVEVGIRGTLGLPLPGGIVFGVEWPRTVVVAAAISGTYPAALTLRRPWREMSTGDGAWYVTVAFYAVAWVGAWLVFTVATVLVVHEGFVTPLAVILSTLLLVHRPPARSDAPLELFLLYWPLGIVVVGLLAGVESLLG